MNEIRLNKVVPNFISDVEQSASEIWHNDATFRLGETCLVSAASGTGKSSLLAYVYGERTDYSGAILFDGQPLDALRPDKWLAVRQTQVSVVFQGLRLFPELTAFENIAIKNRLTRHKTDREICDMLAQVGLSEKIDTRAAQLSFGQQQRVAIIRALCQPSDFLLLDEPFSHLDEANIAIATNLILQEKGDAALILCSLGQKYLFNYDKVITL